jgi:hypothetical protein
VWAGAPSRLCMYAPCGLPGVCQEACCWQLARPGIQEPLVMLQSGHHVGAPALAAADSRGLVTASRRPHCSRAAWCGQPSAAAAVLGRGHRTSSSQQREASCCKHCLLRVGTLPAARDTVQVVAVLKLLHTEDLQQRARCRAKRYTGAELSRVVEMRSTVQAPWSRWWLQERGRWRSCVLFGFRNRRDVTASMIAMRNASPMLCTGICAQTRHRKVAVVPPAPAVGTG